MPHEVLEFGAVVRPISLLLSALELEVAIGSAGEQLVVLIALPRCTERCNSSPHHVEDHSKCKYVSRNTLMGLLSHDFRRPVKGCAAI